MDYKIGNITPYDASNHKLIVQCPKCGQSGVWEALGADDLVYSNIRLGIRKCSNPACWRPMFFCHNSSSGKNITFPFSRIDFNDSDIPDPVKNAFKEALDCHANRCYVASAIMVRKTLEEMCHEQEATGSDLEKRIESLKGKVLFPPEVFEALHDIRFLGNDAAHIISHRFDVGREEVEAGIELCREVLKALYQFKRLKNKLALLKKSPHSSSTI